MRQIITKGIGRTLRGLFGGSLRISRAEGPPVEAVELDGMTVRCYRQWPDERTFDLAWDVLLAQAPMGTTFQSAAWLRRGVGPSLRRGALRLFTVHRAGMLVAVLPMQMGDSGFVESLGYAVSDYLDPLTDGLHDRATWRALVRLLDGVWDGRVKAITFHNVRREASCREILPEVAPAAGFVYEETVIDRVARIRLPETFEAWLESLDAHERKETRRKVRKAQAQAAAQLMTLDRRNFQPALLDTALDLIEAADPDKRDWLRQHVRPVIQRVGRDLVEAGRMRVLLLMLEGKPAASLIDFPCARGPLLYNSGFDPGQRQWSPGAVTFAMAIQDAIARNCAVFDLLRGQEGYKYRLGAVDEPLYRVSLRR